MKILSVIFAFVLLQSCIAFAQPVSNSLLPQVDERLELLSIVYRLSNDNNVTDTSNGVYSKAIANHFNKYLDHPFTKYIKHITDSLAKDSIDIGSWEIPSLAFHLSQPPMLEPLIAYNDIAQLDGWDDRTLLTEKFVSLLHQFYKDATCEAFFKSQQPYYELVNQQCEKQSIKLHKDWIKNFFSLQTTENYYAIISLQNIGVWDYIRVNFQNKFRNTYTIFGCDGYDKNGVPTNFSNPIFARSNLHEYIHAFTNQLIDKNINELQKPSEIILANPKVWRQVKETFYNNWQFLLYESLVRACSIKYMMENKEIITTTEKEIAAQEKAGFFWIRGLVDELNRYEKNRDRYKNLEMFMPVLSKYFINLAEEIKDGKFVFP